MRADLTKTSLGAGYAVTSIVESSSLHPTCLGINTLSVPALIRFIRTASLEHSFWHGLYYALWESSQVQPFDREALELLSQTTDCVYQLGYNAHSFYVEALLQLRSRNHLTYLTNACHTAEQV